MGTTLVFYNNSFNLKIMSSYSISWLNSFDDKQLSKNDYQALLNTVPNATVFNEWAWLTSCEQYLCHNKEIFILVVRKENKLVACVPFIYGGEKLYKINANVIRLLGYPLCDRLALVIHQQEPAIIQVVLEELTHKFPKPWDIIMLSEIAEYPIQDQTITQWAQVTQQAVYKQLTCRVPILNLNQKNLEELVAACPRKLRYELRRRRKKLEKIGNVTIKHYCPTPEQVPQLLENFKQVEYASWKGQKSACIFSTPNSFNFFKDVSRKLAQRRFLDVAEIWVDEQLITYKYGFRYRGVFLDYNIAYLSEYGTMGPGRLLLDEVIKSRFKEKLKAVDASRVGLVSKHLLFERTDNSLSHYQWAFFSASIKGRLLRLLISVVKPFLKRIKSYRSKKKTGI